jgi:hypothetical protein
MHNNVFSLSCFEALFPESKVQESSNHICFSTQHHVCGGGVCGVAVIYGFIELQLILRA